MNALQVKGWCPGAYRPMMAADGLVIRVRPAFARLDAREVLGLCALARRYGQPSLQITNRANVQIRGVAEADHDRVLQGLADLDLLDPDPIVESRRNILVDPFWQAGDLNHALTQALLARLSDLPELPAKVGFAIDCGASPVLGADSADIRLERGLNGLILRAAGASAGRAVTRDTAIPALIEMAQWLAERITPGQRRMSTVRMDHNLPEEWCNAAPQQAAVAPSIGPVRLGALVGCAFGRIDADALAQLFDTQGLAGMRLTPWRMVLLEGAKMPVGPGFVTDPDDPIMRVNACVGAPFCASATVSTRDIARQLAPHVNGTLHVSGCAKGCACRTAADVTLVGRDGTFDFVRNGTPADAPDQHGLTPQDLISGVVFPQ